MKLQAFVFLISPENAHANANDFTEFGVDRPAVDVGVGYLFVGEGFVVFTEGGFCFVSPESLHGFVELGVVTALRNAFDIEEKYLA